MRVFFALLCLFLLFAPHTAVARDVIAGPVEAEVLQVLDGDTVAVRAHIWLGQDIEIHVRINGIDTPEKHGKCESEKIRAEEARVALEKLLASSKINLSKIRYEKYAGRVLATAVLETGQDLAEYMIEKGFARPYHGQKRAGWCQ